ncbi:MAG: HAMP domain-containing sensor histidine kinase, partial [Cyclobacteriaceae bacterium]
RKKRKALLCELPEWPERESVAESLLDLGITQLDPLWNMKDLEEQEVKKLLDILLLEKDISRIGHSLDNMHNVVMSLQDSSRGETGSYALTDIDLESSLNTALILLHNQLKHGTEVNRIFPRHRISVKANPQRLSQVWINLLINAIQTLPDEGGCIELEIDDRYGNFVRVGITDNGSGISPEDQADVFEKFFTTKHVHGGSGLGLHIVREIMGEINGKISFVSRTGTTRMNVFIPKA